ncbi:conserved hypothetical protein [Hyella patelloides LEGE 07179]|uniref:DUF6876 domain-containing protein n=1 Tax=Hyella patelloides LEGE 07179 TaxID=945734 RepID=A0A563W4N1_9CYAN|nr:DUF6876 family protein [Hyella patelloides]VEP18659.1 conserved hypothetical protein [Hyella patelloides LEGE 07179]
MNQEKTIIKPKLKKNIKRELAGFRGTTTYYSYSPLFKNILLTDGTKYLAEQYGCFWLMDAIASQQTNPDLKNHPLLRSLQTWKLEVSEDRSALLSCEWDEDNIIVAQKIPYTTFAYERVDVWVSPYLPDLVFYLPSEY